MKLEDSSSRLELVVLQLPTEKIYLFDSDNTEFADLVQIKDHRKIDEELIKISEISRSDSSCKVNDKKESELCQNQFLNYLKLCPSDGPPKKKSCSPITINHDFEPRRSTRHVQSMIQLTHCPTIPFSSTADIVLVRKTKLMSEKEKQECINMIEQHVSAPPLSEFRRPKWLDRVPKFKRWPVKFWANINNLPTDNYVHQYIFGAVKRKPLLSLKSQLLYAACRSARVRLERLTDEQLKDLKHELKYRTPQCQSSSKHRYEVLKTFHKEAVSNPKPISFYNSTALKSTDDRKFSSASLENGDKPKFRSRPIKRLFRQLKESKNIPLIDLCSSDDDADNNNVNACIRINSTHQHANQHQEIEIITL